MPQTICYEHPLNERIRVLLRLEFLFRQIGFNAAVDSSWNSRLALQGLLEILALTGRNELKTELIKELERQTASLNGLRETPGVDGETLDGILGEIDRTAQSIREISPLSLEGLRQNELLNAVRQRMMMPGGTCPFDLPALYHWLQQNGETRTLHLENWLNPFRPLEEAVMLILRLTRESALPRRETAVQGFFQKALDNSVPNQLIRLLLAADEGAFPEISGSKYRFSVRFMEQPDPNKRPTQANRDIEFRLLCCAI